VNCNLGPVGRNCDLVAGKADIERWKRVKGSRSTVRGSSCHEKKDLFGPAPSWAFI
jgi:hypothetical protein